MSAIKQPNYLTILYLEIQIQVQMICLEKKGIVILQFCKVDIDAFIHMNITLMIYILLFDFPLNPSFMEQPHVDLTLHSHL